MAYEDLDAAQVHCQAIRGLIIHHVGGWRDDVVLRNLYGACQALAATVVDRQCRRHVGVIEDYAGQLYSERAHLAWARGHTSGADYLRLQILRELDGLRSRLYEIESLREAAESRNS
ncbi:MAG: hypothetical protein ACT4P3_01170 [Betaproteobacteria bacterium]